MSSHGLIVIGSGPAGVSAAESFRQYNDELSVSIFTADPDRPYARPPLSKEYLRGETDDVDLHPSQWYTERSIDLVRCATVEDIDLADRGLVVDGTTHRYKSLVIACGASPTPLPVPGGKHALQLRSGADADRLRCAAVGASSVMIIGCEAAASLTMRG